MIKKNELESRRKFLKHTGLIAATGTFAGLFPSSATAKSTDEVKSATEKAMAATQMTDTEAKAKRAKAWHKFLNNPKNKSIRDTYAKGSGKWKIHMLGTASGSEPLPDHNHTSWILENPKGDVFWFDAGEYCSWTAHNMGIDILRCKNVFLSHPHPDHTLGLAGIFCSISKLKWINKDNTPLGLTVHTPVSYPVSGAAMILTNSDNFKGIDVHLIKTGEVYRDDNMVVDAIENNHMARLKDGTCQSYSYRIKMLSEPKKTIIFSGDVKDVDDLAPFFKDGGVDLLMMETGHHVAEKVCNSIKEKYPNTVKEILFVHHGVETLDDMEFENARANAAWGKPVVFSYDKQTIEL